MDRIDTLCQDLHTVREFELRYGDTALTDNLLTDLEFSLQNISYTLAFRGILRELDSKPIPLPPPLDEKDVVGIVDEWSNALKKLMQ